MSNVLKYQAFLVASTSIILIFGFAISTFSIFVLYDQTNMWETIGPQYYRIGVYLASFSGILIILICFLLYFGACYMNRFFIIIGCAFEIIIAIILFIAGILMAMSEKSMDSNLISSMENSLTNWYGKTSLLTNAWDEVQTRLRCCGVSDNGWLLYRNSYWSNTTNVLIALNNVLNDWSPFFMMVPESCCYRTIDGQTGWPSDIPVDIEQCQNYQFGPPRFADGAHNVALYYRGCFNATRSYILNYSRYLSGLSFISILVLALGIFASCCTLLYRSDKKMD